MRFARMFDKVVHPSGATRGLDMRVGLRSRGWWWPSAPSSVCLFDGGNISLVWEEEMIVTWSGFHGVCSSDSSSVISLLIESIKSAYVIFFCF